jgi:hypothetical protein
VTEAQADILDSLSSPMTAQGVAELATLRARAVPEGPEGWEVTEARKEAGDLARPASPAPPPRGPSPTRGTC